MKRKVNFIPLFLMGLFVPIVVRAGLVNPLAVGSFAEMLDLIATFLLKIGFLLAPIVALVAALYFITSAGNPAQVQKGKNALIYTVIGLIGALLAGGFIKLVVGWFTP